jgi:hypothetical protein
MTLRVGFVGAGGAAGEHAASLATIGAAAGALDFDGSDEKVCDLARREAELQSLVVGSEVSPDCWGPHVKLLRSTDERTSRIYSFDDMVRIHERMVTSLEQAEDSADAARRELSLTRDQMQREEAYWMARLSHVHEEVRKIERSLSWRITKPLRAMRALLFGR